MDANHVSHFRASIGAMSRRHRLTAPAGAEHPRRTKRSPPVRRRRAEQRHGKHKAGGGTSEGGKGAGQRNKKPTAAAATKRAVFKSVPRRGTPNSPRGWVAPIHREHKPPCVGHGGTRAKSCDGAGCSAVVFANGCTKHLFCWVVTPCPACGEQNACFVSSRGTA